MTPCLSQLTTLSTGFEQDLKAYAGVACTTIEVWLPKLESLLETRSVADVRALVAEHEVKLAVAAMHGGLLVSQAEAHQESAKLFERRLELLEQLAIPTLVLAADYSDVAEPADYERAARVLGAAARWAARRGVRLALEFQGRSRFCNNLITAAALAARAEQPNVGICFDVFHYYTGPSKFDDLAALTRHNLFHVQLCDLSAVPRELASDSDRILPGDGDFELVPIIDQLRHIGYDGTVSVELMNPNLWHSPPAQVADIAITALRRLLGMTAGRS